MFSFVIQCVDILATHTHTFMELPRKLQIRMVERFAASSQKLYPHIFARTLFLSQTNP